MFVTIENVFFYLIFTPTHLVFGFLIFVYIYKLYPMKYKYINIYSYQKGFCGWDETKERKNSSIKTWKYNTINIPFHIIVP